MTIVWADDSLPYPIREAAEELLPLLYHYETGAFALTVAGSTSKGNADSLSDIDFRVYSENPRPDPGPDWDVRWQELYDRWNERGVVLDGLWFRTVEEVDGTIDDWLSGKVEPDPMIWTIWGYHPLTDLVKQRAVVDTDGLVERWRSRLDPYPAQLTTAIVAHHLPALRYWRQDYHYRNKATRGDFVFLAGLTSLLSHKLLQVLAALNHVYYPGDGYNLRLASSFEIAPANLAERITQVLYPGGTDAVIAQRDALASLIDETEELITKHLPGGGQ